MRFARLTAVLIAAFVIIGVSPHARAYIGEGVQGRPHGGAKAALRYYNFRHGLGYTTHPRRPGRHRR